MTDRELLELAAKAAKIHGTVKEKHGTFALWTSVVSSWNPITDDGDAFRLAVKLAIDFKIRNGATWWDCLKSDGFVYWGHEPHNDDPLAATRRAIVRAAAEIGRQMP